MARRVEHQAAPAKTRPIVDPESRKRNSPRPARGGDAQLPQRAGPVKKPARVGGGDDDALTRDLDAIALGVGRGRSRLETEADRSRSASPAARRAHPQPAGVALAQEPDKVARALRGGGVGGKKHAGARIDREEAVAS